MDTGTRKASSVGMRAFNNVEHGGERNNNKVIIIIIIIIIIILIIIIIIFILPKIKTHILSYIRNREKKNNKRLKTIVFIRSDEGLALETSAIVSFTAFHYPHQHTVDTPVYYDDCI